VTHRRRQNFYALRSSHWQLLAKSPFNILEKFNRVDAAIEANAILASKILAVGLELSGLEPYPSGDGTDWRGTAESSDIDKARSTLRQFYRDWSTAGATERDAAYGHVLSSICSLYPDRDRENIKVLVPGAGLGRFLVELCALGYDVEGNELSCHQWLASQWILNKTHQDDKFDLYPWALSFSNQSSQEAQLENTPIPDVHPRTYLNEKSQGRKTHAFERMNMVAADFCVAYMKREYRRRFDVLATVFFIDTAPDILKYVEAIHNTLTEDGYWVNSGPLLWHFEDRTLSGVEDDGESTKGEAIHNEDLGIDEPGSVELTAEEVLMLIEYMGFEIVESEVREQAQGYIQHPQSLVQTSYKVLYFVALKKGNGSSTRKS